MRIQCLLALLVLVFTARLAISADNMPPEGFIALFNGRDFTGWREPAGGKEKDAFSPVPQSWKIDDGALMYDPTSKKGNAHLQTEAKYKNYELHIDWKFNGRGTTGLFLAPAHVKIWDATKSQSDPSTGSGSLGYGNHMVKPLKKADKPLGEWNRFVIRVQSDPKPPADPAAPKPKKENPAGPGTISIWLNNELVIDKEPRTVRPAPIALQDHGTQVWFRNIFLKELLE